MARVPCHSERMSLLQCTLGDVFAVETFQKCVIMSRAVLEENKQLTTLLNHAAFSIPSLDTEDIPSFCAVPYSELSSAVVSNMV